MNQSIYFKILLTVAMAFVLTVKMVPKALADVYINVMAVNGSQDIKETSVNFNLPGDLSSQDILDTSGLDLDYNINDANYYVHGKVKLQPKETKTFRIHVRDIWKLSPEQIEEIKKEIENGYEQIGKVKDPKNGELLKEQLIQKLDFILQEQVSKSDSVENRMGAFRAHAKELQRIENSALAVDYWRSDPTEVKREKIIRFNIEVTNPLGTVKPYKHKHYLPSEIRPEDLVEFEGFEVRFDQGKKQVFLFREEDLQPKENKKYTIGIRDIWFIPQKDIDYLRSRSNSAYGFLKDSRYASSAQILYDHAIKLLKEIEDAQLQKRDNIMDHISAFRDDQKSYDSAKIDVESLEKLLSIYREDLEKSKVQNILQKMQSLKGVSDVSKAVFNKKFEQSTTWSFIGWVLIFVAFITTVNFIVWFIRSKDSKVLSSKPQATSSESSVTGSQEQGSGKKKTS